jgi:O-antigen/teichoic acid export membrane protein
VAVPVIVSLFGVAMGGEFLLAQTIVMAPAAFIGGSMRDVIHSKLIPCARDNPLGLAKLVKRTALKLMLVASAVYLPIACLAPIVSSPIFGPSWTGVGPLVAMMCPAAIVTVAVSPVSRAMVFSRVPQIKFAADFVKLLLPVAGLIVGADFGGRSLTLAVIGYTVMTALSYGWYFVIILYSIRSENQLVIDTFKPQASAVSTET